MRVEPVREPLSAPFTFKGRSVTELWQTAVVLDSGAGEVSVQSPVWSDPALTDSLGLTGANEAMLGLTRAAAALLQPGTPTEVTPALFAELRARAVALLGIAPSETFLLNSLVPLDCALWHEAALTSGLAFDDLVPPAAQPAFMSRHASVTTVPLVTATTDDATVATHVSGTSPVVKIKVGQAGDPATMIALDAALVERVHRAARDTEVSGSRTGRVRYYLDANCRYPDLDHVVRFLDALSNEARERILLLEEPLPVDCDADVSGLGVPVGADESAHSLADLDRRAASGYTRLAVKPVAKTPTLAFAQVARATELGMAAMVADLTANPCLARWSHDFAVRLAPLPELTVAVAESNGADHYATWDQMLADLHEADDAGPPATAAGRFATLRLQR